MRIAVIAPIALPVPPLAYGGTELVVSQLAEGLREAGHEVTLFASGDSQTTAELRFLYPEAVAPHGVMDKEDYQRHEATHVAWALSQAAQFDVLHDHTKTSGTVLSRFVSRPVVTTIHNDFTPERRAVYLKHRNHPYVAISQAHAKRCPQLNYVGVVYNGLDMRPTIFRREKKGYMLFLGRLCEAKGTHTAIALAQVLRLPLILAGKVDPADVGYFEDQVKPHLDGELVRYVGEVSGRAKWELIADAHCMVFPIQWPEPFGLVMIEAMACGTPVIATRWGSVPEVVCHGVSGWVADDFNGLLEGVQRASQLSPLACRRWVERRFGARAMVDGYLRVYAKLLRERPPIRGRAQGLAP